MSSPCCFCLIFTVSVLILQCYASPIRIEENMRWTDRGNDLRWDERGKPSHKSVEASSKLYPDLSPLLSMYPDDVVYDDSYEYDDGDNVDYGYGYDIDNDELRRELSEMTKEQLDALLDSVYQNAYLRSQEVKPLRISTDVGRSDDALSEELDELRTLASHPVKKSAEDPLVFPHQTAQQVREMMDKKRGQLETLSIYGRPGAMVSEVQYDSRADENALPEKQATSGQEEDLLDNPFDSLESEPAVSPKKGR